MPVAGLDPEKCARRNRIEAKRGEVNAFPIRFVSNAEDGSQVVTARGTMPRNDEEALARINEIAANVNPNGKPLTADDVWIRYMEAANSSLIESRNMFLDATTLRNVATDAQAGVAFMNSHRTGGMSEPTELPFGRTFAGRYEVRSDGNGNQSVRSLLGVYMLRGVKPNGDGGPSTDDLARGIDAGTVFDVSVGLARRSGTRVVCDVCGEDLNAINPDTGDYACPHIPGTKRKMSAAQVASQKSRGVPSGCATYSLVDAGLSEVSAVYDGAVPGAGFKKLFNLSRSGGIDSTNLAEAREAYANLLEDGDLSMDQDETKNALQAFVERIDKGFASLKEAILSRKPETEADDEPPANPASKPDDSAELLAAKAELATLKAERDKGDIENALAGVKLNERGATFVPRTRQALTEALSALPADARKGVLDALSDAKAVETGEQGFKANPNGTAADQLSASELATCERIAKENGYDPETVKANYLQAKTNHSN